MDNCDCLGGCVDCWLLTRSLDCVGGEEETEEVSCWGVVVSRCRRGVVLLVSGSPAAASSQGRLAVQSPQLTDWRGPDCGEDWAGQQDLLGGQSALDWAWKGQRGCNYSSVTSCCPPAPPSSPSPSCPPRGRPSPLTCQPSQHQLTVALHQSQPSHSPVSALQLGEMSKFK